jgi:DNA mismatch repair protein MutL
MPIQVLSEQLASQIAAGEVVERPFSVVKELVENSIDAAATTIFIDVRQGGRELIQVADNGTGISAEEVEMAFQRHATSKLGSADDLQAIHTLGFRGEALAAIAAVSRVTVVSRAHDEKAGVRLAFEGGRVTGREPVGAPQGTVIGVENLFYNVPARLKFLKSVSSEKRLIDEFVTRYALAYPHVRFRLTHDGRITFQTSGSGRLEDVLVAVYGPETMGQLLEIAEERRSGGAGEQGDEEDSISQSLNLSISQSPLPKSAIEVRGYVGGPSLHWSNRSHITLFVNGRWIRDNRLTFAVIQAYHTLLPTGRYPLGLIFLNIPLEDVDVNVHPTKVEVRFRYENQAFGAVQRAVRETLLATSPVRPVSLWPTLDHDGFAISNWSAGQPGAGNTLSVDREWMPRASNGMESDDEGEASGRLAGEAEYQAADEQATLPANDLWAAAGGERLPILRVIGQVGTAYIIAEGPEGLYLIDQHAAHERVLYEQFMARRQRGGVVSQGLVTGAAVHLTPPQAVLLEENLALLTRLGFEIESFGPQTFMVRAIPAILSHRDPAQALVGVVSELEEERAPLEANVEAALIRRVCKTAAIKAGQTLSPQEMEALIQQLEACANPHTCPHGRPTLIHLSAAQLARQFGR